MNPKRFPRGLYAPETLESRIAPATIIVNSLLDNGDGANTTLREAIVQANLTAAADTIIFSPAVLPGTIVLNGTEIAITSTLTIKGPGVDKLAVSGNNLSRIFNIDDSNSAVLHPATISGLTLVDGNSGSAGGAIKSTESLTLSNLVITSNVAARGGGVYVDTTGRLVVSSVRFTDNEATSGNGGALYANASRGIVVAKSLVSGNRAALSGGGMYLQVDDGTKKTSTITVDATTFVNNASGSAGGALHLDHDGGGKMLVRNSIFTGNTSATLGGALYLDEGLLTVDRCVFARNSATADGGAIADGAGTEPTSLTVKNSRFEGNSSGSDGGALKVDDDHKVSITGSSFIANKSTARGGAIQAEGGVIITIKSSTFADNSTPTAGGAISVSEGGSMLTLISSTVSGNTAADGGGIHAATGAKLVVTGGSFVGNSATGDGGGVAATGTGANAVNLSVTGTLFHGNRAGSDGGGVHTIGDGTVGIRSARVIGNHSAVHGGGMYLATSTKLTILSSLFQHNAAGGDGGGLATSLESAVAIGTITGSKFLDNFADSAGGGIALDGIAGAVLTVKGSLVSGNVALVEGGGIRRFDPTLTLIGAIVSGNWASAGPNIFP